MYSLPLDGEWRLFHYPAGTLSIGSPEELLTSGLSSLPAQVPGNVELDLLRAGEIPDPYVGGNVEALREFETHEWWYLCTFTAPAEMTEGRIELVFRGVDCLATYWLNGERLGESANMFIEHRFNVSGRLRPGATNVLAVHLASAVLAARHHTYDPGQMALPNVWEQLWLRKAPHSYGWDIMPRAVSAGLWRPVELHFHQPREIESLYFHTVAVSDGRATLGVHYQVRTADRRADDHELRVTGTCGDRRFSRTERLVFVAGAFKLAVDDPALWWPRGYGEPNLYTVTSELIRAGEVVDRRIDRIGLRTAELTRTDVTTAEHPGEFLFRVNGQRVLCKGTNWVPADMFHSRDAGRYEAMLDLAVDLGCNVVRCWGGNVYEDHAFFDRCDREGLLVWQDFAMACARYPQTPEFRMVMRAEAEAVVRKLRNHPSLLIWCGDNECDCNYVREGIDPAVNRVTREVLADVVAQCDPHRPYVPSSPYWSPGAVSGKCPHLRPEQHLWGPRDYYKSGYYTESTYHFVGEIGYHGCPNVGSVRRFLDEEHVWPWQDNPQWIIHGTESVPWGPPRYRYRIRLMADQIAEMFGRVPDNLAEFALASQISQAEAKKFFVEMTRLRKWRRTGIIWWNLIDGWPQFSDSVVDYYYGKKLAYHYLRRVQQPVCLMIDEPRDWRVKLVAGNDSLRAAAGNYCVRDGDTGEVLLSGTYGTAANENRELGQMRASRGTQRLFLIEWTLDGATFGNHYLLGTPPFDLARYRFWLARIAVLPPAFAAERVAE